MSRGRPYLSIYKVRWCKSLHFSPLVRMSDIFSKSSRLTTSYNFSKIEAVPAWGLGAIVRAPHSTGAASIASSTSRTAAATRRNIDRSEPCFVTGRASYTHERAHWVNAVRKNPTRKRKVVSTLWPFTCYRELTIYTGNLPCKPWYCTGRFRFE